MVWNHTNLINFHINLLLCNSLNNNFLLKILKAKFSAWSSMKKSFQLCMDLYRIGMISYQYGTNHTKLVWLRTSLKFPILARDRVRRASGEDTNANLLIVSTTWSADDTNANCRKSSHSLNNLIRWRHKCQLQRNMVRLH